MSLFIDKYNSLLCYIAVDNLANSIYALRLAENPDKLWVIILFFSATGMLLTKRDTLYLIHIFVNSCCVLCMCILLIPRV